MTVMAWFLVRNIEVLCGQGNLKTLDIFKFIFNFSDRRLFKSFLNIRKVILNAVQPELKILGKEDVH